jgi:hypothetical protein
MRELQDVRWRNDMRDLVVVACAFAVVEGGVAADDPLLS